jgi:hypothetical protein
VIASRRTLGRVVVALLAAVAFYLSLRESPESRIQALLERLAHALHRAPDENELEWRRGLQQVFARDLTSSAQLVAPELGTVEGRERLLELAVESGGLFEIELEPSGIQLEKRSASARLRLFIVLHAPGSERREARVGSVALVRDGQAFRVQSIEIEHALREQPEARP